MEYQNTINLLDNTQNQPSEFKTKNQLVDESAVLFNPKPEKKKKKKNNQKKILIFFSKKSHPKQIPYTFQKNIFTLTPWDNLGQI